MFESEAWIANLLAHGFERAPVQHVLPLPVAPDGTSARFHLMQPSPGAALLSLSNYYSSLYGPTGDLRHLSTGQWLEIAHALRKLPGGAEVRLQPLDANSEWLAGLETGLRRAGCWTDRYFCFGNWYQPVEKGGFEAYWAARPSALRHSIERGRKRLTRAGQWAVQIASGAHDDLEPALAAFLSVYARSWKQPEPCPGFMPSVVRLAARTGWLRLGVLSLDGAPLAAQVWLVDGGKANIYKLAYVEGQERLSVGSVLTAALMQHVIDVDHVQEVDYLTGDDAYKADWMALRRERVGLVAFDPRRAAGILAAARHFGGRLRR